MIAKVARPGRYRIRASVRWARRGGNRGRSQRDLRLLRKLAPGLIEVLDQSGPQQHEIKIDPAELKRVIAKLRASKTGAERR